MSDESDTPDEGNEEQTEQHEALSADTSAFFVNPAVSGKSMSEDDWAMWGMVRDTAFEHTIVNGTKPPEFEVKVQSCASGCHATLYISDTANDEHYMVQQLPAFLAQISGWVDFNGNINPALGHHEMRRRQAVLN